MYDKLIAIIAEQLGKDPSEITMETDFKEDLEADSLDLFQVISDIEDTFDVKIEDAEGIKTVGDALKMIEGQKEQ